jgi:hypothetical protein
MNADPDLHYSPAYDRYDKEVHTDTKRTGSQVTSFTNFFLTLVDSICEWST